MVARERGCRLLDIAENDAKMPAAKGSSTNAAMPAKLGPPGTGAQAGDPSTMKKEAPTTNWQ